MKYGALSEFFCHIQHFFRQFKFGYPFGAQGLLRFLGLATVKDFAIYNTFFRRVKSVYPLARKVYNNFYDLQLSKIFVTYLFLFTTHPVRTIINLTGGGILYAHDS